MAESPPHTPTEVRFTPVGVVFFFASALSTVSGLLMLSGPVFAAGVTGLVLLGLCRGLSARHLDRVSITRSVPYRARAGESFTVETVLTPVRGFPEGTTVHFSDPLAPTRLERPVTLTGTLPSRLRYTGKSRQRGYLRSRPWTIRSTWPLDFFVASRRGAFQDNHPLLLQPMPFLPNRLKSHLSRLTMEYADNSPDPPDPSSDFRLLREFRSGDPVRRIHWPSSLRTGQLHVVELEPPRPKPRSYGILIHSYEPAGQVLTPETFEMVLRIAAGLLQRFQYEEIPVLFQHHPEKFETLSHRGAIAESLDHLSLCRRSPLPDLESLRQSENDFRFCDEVFVLSDCPRHEWEAQLRGHFPVVTFIDSTSLSVQSRPGLKTRLRHRP